MSYCSVLVVIESELGRGMLKSALQKSGLFDKDVCSTQTEYCQYGNARFVGHGGLIQSSDLELSNYNHGKQGSQYLRSNHGVVRSGLQYVDALITTKVTQGKPPNLFS